MKRKIIGILIMAICLCSIMEIPVQAREVTNEKKEGKTVTITGDLENPDSYSEKVLELMNNEDILEVTVIDPAIEEGEEINNISNLTKEDLKTILPREDEIMPLGGPTYYKYRVTNVRNGSDYTGTSKIATVSGTPGMTISISKTKTVGRTYSVTVGTVSKSQINAAVGYSVSGSDSISISGAYKVPKKCNGKNVKSASLNAYVIYKTKNFTVQRQKVQNVLHFSWTDYGSGYSRKPYGISFRKTYIYK